MLANNTFADAQFALIINHIVTTGRSWADSCIQPVEWGNSGRLNPTWQPQPTDAPTWLVDSIKGSNWATIDKVENPWVPDQGTPPEWEKKDMQQAGWGVTDRDSKNWSVRDIPHNDWQDKDKNTQTWTSQKAETDWVDKPKDIILKRSCPDGN